MDTEPHEATLYLDESGNFSGRHARGLRAIGGPLLAGTREQHRTRLEPLLREAFDWLPPPWHAVELASTESLLYRLYRKKITPPKRLEQATKALRSIPFPRLPCLRATHPDHYHKLKQESRRLLQRVRARVGPICKTCAPESIIHCIEHDMVDVENRYPAMLAAAACGGVLRLAQRVKIGGRGRFHLVIASGPADQHLDATAEAVCSLASTLDRTHDISIEVGQIGLADAKKEPGLVLADIVEHALGPGPAADRPVRTVDACRVDRDDLRRECAQRFCFRFSPFVISDATLGLVSRVLQGDTALEEARRIATGRRQSASLIAGSYLAAEDQLSELLTAIAEWTP